MKMPIYIMYFRCKWCQNKWKVYREEIQKTSKCESCYSIKRYINYRKITNRNSNIRCFGYFQCTNCENEWVSAYTWILYRQRCFQCRIKTAPHSLAQLKESDYYDPEGDPNKYHKTSYCQKCLEVGDCRDYAQENDDYYYYYDNDGYDYYGNYYYE